MTARSSALPYAAVAVLAVLSGVSNGVRQYLPVLVDISVTAPIELTTYLLAMEVANTLFVPVGAVVVGATFADGLDVETRLGATVVVTLLLAAVGYLAGFSVVFPFVPGDQQPLFAQLLSAAVVGLTNGITLTVAVVAGAAVRRLRDRPAAEQAA